MEILLPILISFIICVCISPVLIPVLKKMKFGQQILEDGPTWHKSKSGTPTMGGISFITGIVIRLLFAVRFLDLVFRQYLVFLLLYCAV